MDLKDFKIVRNKQRPKFCYAYEKYNNSKTAKYSIFTINSGKTFLTTVTSMNNSGKLVDLDFSKTYNSPEDGLNGIKEFLSKK